jgi:polyphenol oxidase
MTPGENEIPGWLAADWPVPAGIRAGTSLRGGGASRAPYASLNLAGHVGDDSRAVSENRRRLAALLQLPAEPIWLEQIHGNRVIAAHDHDSNTADAAWTDQPGIVCAILTADCLPLLLCDRHGTRVAAVHVGWRGLAAGIIDQTVTALAPAGELLAWMGPCIGPDAYEVGDDVYQACRSLAAQARAAFTPTRPGHWLADLPQLVRLILADKGVAGCYGGDCCTYSDANRFYSYRRDGATGRMASLIWIDADHG